jgi:adenylate kinase
MDRGAYVPDELTNALIADRIARTDTDSGFLLDGYPRTTDQADYLGQLLAQRGQVLERVINFRVDHEELTGRLLQRAIEQGRRDDTEAVIRRRQEVYAEETAPLLASYADRGILITIDGVRRGRGRRSAGPGCPGRERGDLARKRPTCNHHGEEGRDSPPALPCCH